MRAERVLLPLALLLASGSALAQAWRSTADLRLGATWTDNVDLQQHGGDSDFVFDVTPRIGVSGRSARLTGSLSAELGNYYYLDRAEENSSNLGLSANGLLEAWDDFLFIDGRASISREVVSAFGAQTGDERNISGNRAEVSSFSLSPFVRFRFGNAGAGELRYRASQTDSDSETLGSTLTQEWTAQLRNGSAFGRLGWGLNARVSDGEQGGGAGVGDAKQRSLRGQLFYSVSRELRLSASAGREDNDFSALSGSAADGSTWGAGFEWTPDPRTSLAGSSEHRFFGTGYDWKLTHRWARAAVDASLVRDVSSSSDAYSVLLAQASPQYRAAYELLASRYPDPIERDRQVQALLRQLNIPAFQLIPGRVLTSSYFLSRRASAALHLSGVRNTVSLSLFRSEQENLGDLSVSASVSSGDLATNEQVEQTGAGLSWSSRLSGLTTLSASLNYVRSEGSGGNDPQQRRQTDYGLGLSTQIGAQSTGGLSYRHVRASGSDPYTENSVSANFAHRF